MDVKRDVAQFYRALLGPDQEIIRRTLHPAWTDKNFGCTIRTLFRYGMHSRNEVIDCSFSVDFR